MVKKKQGRKTNKKKGGGGGTSAARRITNNNDGTTHSNEPSALLKGEIPDFGNMNHPVTKHNYSTIYARYKSATRRFLQYMRGNVPKEEIGDDTTCNFLLTAADWMIANSHILDINIMRDLKLCIRMRNRVAKSMFGGGDSGHKYFLEVLIYCYTVLRLLPVEKKIDIDTEEEVENMQDENRFSALYNEEEEDDVEDDKECFPAVVPRPEPRADPVSIEELLASDDRNDAILFLLSLDELTEVIAGQYRVMVKNIRNDRRRGYSDTTMIHNLMDATIVANFSIQAVQKMEMELQTQHDHLTTPCRLLSCLVLPELTANVSSIVRERGAKLCDRRDIIAFLGDSMECTFLNPSDEWNRMDSIVGDFCRKYEVDAEGSAQIEQIFAGIRHITILEIPIKPEITSDLHRMRATLERETGKPHNSHSWLTPHMAFIGGDRSIHHTVRLLQLFAGAVDKCPLEKTLGPARKGMFGRLTDYPSKFSDMDELLMSHLLPNWVNMCRHGIVGKAKLPHSSELSPLFLQLKSFVDNPRRSVSWSCAFSVHAVLTGIFEVATERQHITNISKLVFDNYFTQVQKSLKALSIEKASSMTKSPAMQNIVMVSFLENFGLNVYEESALWNPLCAGTNLSILDFLGNIEGGCAVIDCQAQLRIVLYLYHGLVINGMMQEDEIPLLHILYKSFKNCKALWQGSLPCRGELVKKFWVSFGMGLKESKQMSESARLLAQGGPVSPGGVFHEGLKHCRGRKMKPIEPSEISTAFRRICDRDFSDVVDKYHTPEQRKRSSHTEQYVVAVHTNDTLDHLDEEVQLHSVNFISTAYNLEQFICSLGRVLQWDSLLETFKQTSNLDMRQGFAIIFAQHLLGALGFAPDPLNHQFRNAPMLTRQAPTLFHGVCGFLEMYFSRVPPTNVLWFQGIESGDDSNVELIGSGATRR